MSQVAFLGRIAANHLGGTPAADIVTRAGHELWHHTASHAALISQLCDNFHWYGRNNGWQWIKTVGGNGGAQLGRPLVAGQATATNCGGFNASVRWIAHNILQVPAAQFTNMGATTTESFITRTGTQAIDAGWTGNVRTLAQDFATFGAYRFTAHSWNLLTGGAHYDASTGNTGFANRHALYYCTLGYTARNAASCYVVAMHHQAPAAPGPAPYFCISSPVLKQQRHQFPVVAVPPHTGGVQAVTQGFINSLPLTTGPGAWDAFLLVSSAHLPPAFVSGYL